MPIVFAAVADPIGSGFVASLPRPGSNITGVMQYEATVTGKWLAMLKEIAPSLERAAFVANPETATYYDYYLRAAEAVAPSLKSMPTRTAASKTPQFRWTHPCGQIEDRHGGK
jgi:putative tryptophan/tyrosine transport system substrate-binding protein